MTFLHLFIINKSGGLIYHRKLSNVAPSLDVNILLSIGSTFHSLCSIAVEACPVKKLDVAVSGGNNNNTVTASSNSSTSSAEDGIEIIEGEGIILCCFQTLTGVKFVLT